MQGIGNILNSYSAKNSQLKNRVCGFTQVKNLLIDNLELSTYEKLVFIVLKRHVGAKEYCWPSLTTIAKKAGCSESTVKKAINGLIGRGLIEKRRGEKVRSNEYRINNRGSPYT